MNIGETIAKLRREQGLTQEQLADKLCVSRQAISKWETNKALPDLDNIRILSEFFGVSTDVFLKPSQASPKNESSTETNNSSENKSESTEENDSDNNKSDNNSGTIQPSESNTLFKEKKHERKKHPLAAIIFTCLITLFFMLVSFAVPYVLGKFQFMLSCHWLMAFIATAIGAIGGFIAVRISLRNKSCGRIVLLIAAVLALAIAENMWYSYFTAARQFTEYTSQSPDGRHSVIIRYDNESEDAVCYRSFRQFSLLMRKAKEIPYSIDGEPKMQWTADDVCAVTYIGNDGIMHQYVATFGDRSSGNSYYYVTTAIYGDWSGVEEGTQSWKIQSPVSESQTAQRGIMIKIEKVGVIGGIEEYYTYSDCVQFGTTAIVLCRGGLPRWTITINPGGTVENALSYRLSPGSTITLTQVSMNETPSYIFKCDDDTEKQAQLERQSIYDVSNTKKLHETVALMKKLANENDIVTNELPDGVYLIDSASSDLQWTLFMYDYNKAEMATHDQYVQYKHIHLTAGDNSDGCWLVKKTFNLINPGTKGSEPKISETPLSYYVRLIKTKDGKYLYLRSIENLSFGLDTNETDAEDLSVNAAYHWFIPHEYTADQFDYDTGRSYETMYDERLSPEEAAQKIYNRDFAENYPNAMLSSRRTLHPEYYLLNPNTDGNKGIYLQYDGICQKDGKWVYRFWLFRLDSTNINKWNGTVETLGYRYIEMDVPEKSTK